MQYFSSGACVCHQHFRFGLLSSVVMVCCFCSLRTHRVICPLLHGLVHRVAHLPSGWCPDDSILVSCSRCCVLVSTSRKYEWCSVSQLSQNRRSRTMPVCMPTATRQITEHDPSPPLPHTSTGHRILRLGPLLYNGEVCRPPPTEKMTVGGK